MTNDIWSKYNGEFWFKWFDKDGILKTYRCDNYEQALSLFNKAEDEEGLGDFGIVKVIDNQEVFFAYCSKGPQHETKDITIDPPF